jgi:hypothetical protein
MSKSEIFRLVLLEAGNLGGVINGKAKTFGIVDPEALRE